MPTKLQGRGEGRTPLKVMVDLSSLDVRRPAQEGITENVSARGARVVTNKPWQPNERLNVRSLQGLFVTTRSEEHTSELQSPVHLVCRLLLEKKKYHHHMLPCSYRHTNALTSLNRPI